MNGVEWKSWIGRIAGLISGTLIYMIGLEFFLVPNHIIDGGVVGVSLMAAAVTSIPFSFWVVILNIPFFYLGYRQIGRALTVSSLIAVGALSAWGVVLKGYSPVTTDPFLSTIFGGIIIGIGVGIVIRSGGSTDGTEIVAIWMDKQMSFSVGEIIMFFNLFILGSAGFVFSWNSAMYSLVAYFIAYKMIDVVTEGLDESKGAFIVSDRYQDVADAVVSQMGRAVTLLYGEGGYLKEQKKILYCVVTRLEITRLKKVVYASDPNAFISVFDVKEVQGGQFGKR
ncbi:MAG TPA: hypothetical protein DCS74_01175 [Veillonellaceae bacterium]|jgi:uncharacterized membrane-anchored protein YitT (DUF2179 family)|nr:hypothetical protein [Veillonellaceae bacterium]